MYHPMHKKALVVIDMPIEGFFNGANAIAEAMAFLPLLLLPKEFLLRL